MIRAFKHLFVDHPREVGETYLEHAGVATRMGWRLARLSGCAFLHAVAGILHHVAAIGRDAGVADLVERAIEAAGLARG